MEDIQKEMANIQEKMEYIQEKVDDIQEKMEDIQGKMKDTQEKEINISKRILVLWFSLYLPELQERDIFHRIVNQKKDWWPQVLDT